MSITQSHYDRPYNVWLGTLRRGLTAVFLLALLAMARPTLLSVVVGAVLVAVGEAVRAWAAGHLLKTTELIISGPYRYTRNPLYLGRLLIFTGLCIMALMPYGANWYVLGAGWLLFFGYYLRRKEKTEPARLRSYHGDPYDRYFAAVPALFPTFRAYEDSSDGSWARERFLRNREHWMVIGLTLATVFLLWLVYNPLW